MDAFWYWWQHLPDHMDPVIFQIGSFRLQYYGLMYIVAFGITYLLVRHRVASEKRFAVSQETVSGLMTAMIIGLILGARLGYVIFYNFSYYAHHPLEIVLPFEFAGGIHFTGISGMSYHGGLIGVVASSLIYIKRHRLDFWQMADLFIPAIPLGYSFGRLGNFINGELYGRPTRIPIGMYFPAEPDGTLRHPSQLYEAFFEGLVLFAVLWWLKDRIHRPGMMLPLYLAAYGGLRFCIEFFRQPDAQLGFVWLGFSMGQVLCGVMILTAGLLMVYLRRRGATTNPQN